MSFNAQRDYLNGEHIFHDWWIVKLEVQGDYTKDQIIEFARNMNVVVRKYAGNEVIIRSSHGVKHKSDSVIHLNLARRCLRFFVYNICTRNKAQAVYEVLHKTCVFFNLDRKKLILRPKPAPIIITPERIEVRGQAHGRRSI